MEYKEQIRHILEQWCDNVAASDPRFDEGVRYIVLSDAKYARSVCAYLIMNGFSQPITPAFEQFIVSIELIHASSLIFDDLPCMDNAALRRGKPTHHVQYGEAQTVLTALYLLTEAYRCIGHDPQMTALLSDIMGANGLVFGQYLDLHGAKDTFEQVSRIHELKTSPLFAYAFVGAALFAKASDAFVADMRTVSRHIGIAFQLWDDYLDRYGSSAETGKDSGLDNDKYSHHNDKDALLAAFNKEYSEVNIVLSRHTQTGPLMQFLQKLRERTK